MQIQESIIRILDELPGAERRLADVVLSNINQLAIYSAHELAAMANVSAATAVRFFRRLGFSGFNAFRMAAREQMNDGAPFVRLSELDASSFRGDMTPYVNSDIQNITATFEALAQSHLDKFIERTLEAKRVWVAGFRNGQTLACYAHSLLQQLRGDVHLLVGTVAHLTEQMSDIQHGDLVLVMDFRRRSVLLPKVVDYVRSEDVQLAFLTDGLESTLLKNRDIAFMVKTRGEGLFDSHASTLSLINFLVSRVALQAEATITKKLQKIESIHRSFHDLKSE